MKSIIDTNGIANDIQTIVGTDPKSGTSTSNVGLGIPPSVLISDSPLIVVVEIVVEVVVLCLQKLEMHSM
jgi:hypothetical protein